MYTDKDKARRKKYYWDHREESIKYASNWNKINKEKRAAIMRKDNAKRALIKRLWVEQTKYGGNATIIDKQCSFCKTKENLHIHHRDGRNGKRGRALNNSSENLIILCVACHASVHGWWGLKTL